MRIPSLLIASVLLAPSAWTQDERPFYLQFGFGGVFSETADDVPGGSIGFDPGYATSLAVGHAFGLSESFAFEAQLEGYYQYFTVDEDELPNIPTFVPGALDDNAKAFAILVNGIFDWHFTQQYSLYAGVGVGYAPTIEYDSWDSGSLSTTDNSGLAYQGLFGFSYNLGGSYDVRLGYRYFRTEPININDAITGDNTEIDVGQSVFEAAFRWAL